jgi:hypothetical protein
VKLVNWGLVKLRKVHFLTQSTKNFKNRVDIIIRSVRSEWDNTMLVSSAHRIGTDLFITNLVKSLTKMRKAKVPKPNSGGHHVDVVIFFISLYSNVLCYLLAR